MTGKKVKRVDLVDDLWNMLKDYSHPEAKLSKGSFCYMDIDELSDLISGLQSLPSSIEIEMAVPEREINRSKYSEIRASQIKDNLSKYLDQLGIHLHYPCCTTPAAIEALISFCDTNSEITVTNQNENPTTTARNDDPIKKRKEVAKKLVIPQNETKSLPREEKPKPYIETVRRPEMNFDKPPKQTTTPIEARRARPSNIIVITDRKPKLEKLSTENLDKKISESLLSKYAEQDLSFIYEFDSYFQFFKGKGKKFTFNGEYFIDSSWGFVPTNEDKLIQRLDMLVEDGNKIKVIHYLLGQSLHEIATAFSSYSISDHAHSNSRFVIKPDSLKYGVRMAVTNYAVREAILNWQENGAFNQTELGRMKGIVAEPSGTDRLKIIIGPGLKNYYEKSQKPPSITQSLPAVLYVLNRLSESIHETLENKNNISKG